MSSLPKSSNHLTVEEYLAGEPLSDLRHEYLGGAVYGMAGASETHNIIAANVIIAVGTRLRGKPCQVLGSDMKVRIEISRDTYFYYPDAMVACDPADTGNPWKRRPSVLFEIISEDTRRVDEREKKLAYGWIDSLTAYVLIEQVRAEVVVEHRAAGAWRQERFSGLDAVIDLPSIGVALPLSELYDRVTF